MNGNGTLIPTRRIFMQQAYSDYHTAIIKVYYRNEITDLQLNRADFFHE